MLINKFKLNKVKNPHYGLSDVMLYYGNGNSASTRVPVLEGIPAPLKKEVLVLLKIIPRQPKDYGFGTSRE